MIIVFYIIDSYLYQVLSFGISDIFSRCGGI